MNTIIEEYGDVIVAVVAMTVMVMLLAKDMHVYADVLEKLFTAIMFKQ